jgi:hypothetical protein
MQIKTFNQVAQNISEHSSILVRGPHGIGKSQLAHQLGDELSLPIVDRRLSQMSEGDMVGLPELVDGVTRFCPPDWYVKACKAPVVLLLDEINRATPEVMQAAFQIVLDRELNGHKLHKDTRIIACVNASADYQVNEMDPALLDRFWVVDLEPTIDDWIEWAQENSIDSVIVDFIRQNNAHLRYEGSIEPGKIYPSPRSYEKLNQVLVGSNMNPSSLAGRDTPPGFYATCLGFIGTEAAITLNDFVKAYEYQVSAEDILDNFEETKGRISKLTTDKLNSVYVKLVDHCKSNEWSVSQSRNVHKFSKLLSGESMVALWNGVMESGVVNNITKLHKFMGQDVVEAVSQARNLG